jgi:hypothetical protein
MDIFFGLFFVAIGLYAVNTAEQRQRIILLSSHLRKFQLETLMEQLVSGYLRAAGEKDPERAEPIWRSLEGPEQSVQKQLQQLAESLHEVWNERTRVSRWPIAVPFSAKLVPASTFDLRALVALHAKGFETVLRNEEGLGRKELAFRLTAELLLFQHSCHWFCRSRSVASARLLAQHRTAHEQVLDAVSPQTRKAYRALVEG